MGLCQNNSILLSEVLDDVNYLAAKTSSEQWKNNDYIFLLMLIAVSGKI